MVEKEENLLEKIDLSKYVKQIDELKKEIKKTVIGQEKAINAIIRGILANGHVLVEGVPGIAKTLLIRSLSQASGCEFSRIQFTVDLLPTDITGLTTYDDKKKDFSVVRGPIFANFVIADEVNRAPPKTQSALLEAMQERQVTIGKKTQQLPSPFFIMANNNPLESSGTYPLPEAQIDRFLFKMLMEYVSPEEELEVIDKNISIRKFEEYQTQKIINPKKILEMQGLVKKVYASDKVKKYVVSIVDATRNPKKYGLKTGKYIEWGASPRATIGLIIASKADAFMEGKKFITPENVRNVCKDVLRHRLILNYQGQAENIRSEEIIEEILSKIKLP